MVTTNKQTLTRLKPIELNGQPLSLFRLVGYHFTKTTKYPTLQEKKSGKK